MDGFWQKLKGNLLFYILKALNVAVAMTFMKIETEQCDKASAEGSQNRQLK